MKKHIYVLLSVLLWGISQFLIDRLLLVFSPSLLILLRFLFSGIFILINIKRLPWQEQTNNTHNKKTPFHFKYILTGGLGAFGYYILIAYALSISSVPFVSIMGGVLPVLAIILDRLVVKQKSRIFQLMGAGISLLGIFFFSFEADFKWNYAAAVLMVLANVSWLFYGYLKKKWKIGEDSSVLGYEFISTAFLTLPFFQAFKILAPITTVHIIELIAVIVLATILPYKFYLKGSKALPISTASMYLNLLPVTSLLPGFIMGDLKLTAIQAAGVIVLILSALIGNIQISPKAGNSFLSETAEKVPF